MDRGSLRLGLDLVEFRDITVNHQGFMCKITDKTKIWDKQGRLIIQATAFLSSTPLHWFWSKLIISTGAVYSLQDGTSYHLWHIHFGYSSKNALHHAHKHLKGVPTLHDPPSKGLCKGCLLGKAYECAFPASSKCANCVLGLVHTDLCEFPLQSRSHTKWMITFIDNASGFAALHFLYSKADAVTALKDLVAWAKAQMGFRLHSIHLD